MCVWQDVLQVLTQLVQATQSRGPSQTRQALQGRVGSVVRACCQQLAAQSGQATKTKSAVLALLKALVPLREVRCAVLCCIAVWCPVMSCNVV